MEKSSKGFSLIVLLFWLAVVSLIGSGFIYKNFSDGKQSALERGIKAKKDAQNIVDKLEIDNKIKQDYLYE